MSDDRAPWPSGQSFLVGRAKDLDVIDSFLADGEHRGRLTDRTHHGQSVGGEHARVRKPEQHQRLRGGQRREGCRDDDGETGGGKQQPT